MFVHACVSGIFQHNRITYKRNLQDFSANKRCQLQVIFIKKLLKVPKCVYACVFAFLSKFYFSY